MANTVCRCCGKPARDIDGYPIHTGCIAKHWGQHAHGLATSRCQEFGSAKGAGK